MPPKSISPLQNFKVTDITHHRNGIMGRPFDSVRFSFEAADVFYPNMLAIVPEYSPVQDVECYVVDMNNPAECWRGDNFVDLVRTAIKAAEDIHRRPTRVVAAEKKPTTTKKKRR